MSTRFLFLILTMAAGAGLSPCQSCTAWESRKSIDGIKMIFELDPHPWKVTADLDANVTIRNTAKKSSCKTQLESVSKVYFGSGDLIYFRSTEIASDELFTVNGLTCKEVRKVRQLDQKSEANTTRILRSLGICSRK
jgi:hypothetical protein